MYALIPTLTGSLVGVLAGEKIFPLAIMKTYALLYEGLDTFLLPYNWTEGLIAVFAGVLCTGLAAVFASYSLAHAKPERGINILKAKFRRVFRKNVSLSLKYGGCIENIVATFLQNMFGTVKNRQKS